MIRLLTFIILIIPLQSFAQEYRCVELQYVDNLESWETLNQDFKTNQIVLFGEAPHGMPANTYLQTEFAIYLNKQFNTRYILIEFGNSYAYLLNKFLNSGDTSYYNRGYYGFLKFKEARESFQKLLQYNNSLNDNSKIKFVGLDFESEPSLSSSIYFFLREFENETQLNQLRNKVKARFDTVRFDEPQPFLDYIRMEMPKFENIFNRSDDWSIIKDIIHYKSSYEEFDKRDKYMMERFSNLPQNEKYLGFFGTNHTRKEEEKVFAGILHKKNFPVLVINLHHENSFYRQNLPVEYAFLNDIGFFSKKNIKHYLNYFGNLVDCNIFLTKVEPVDSHFKKLKQKTDYVIYIENQNGYTKE